jgi:hypothetical protein
MRKAYRMGISSELVSENDVRFVYQKYYCCDTIFIAPESDFWGNQVTVLEVLAQTPHRELVVIPYNCPAVHRSGAAGQHIWYEGGALRLPCGCVKKVGKAGVASPYHFMDGEWNKYAERGLNLVKDLEPEDIMPPLMPSSRMESVECWYYEKGKGK